VKEEEKEEEEEEEEERDEHAPSSEEAPEAEEAPAASSADQPPGHPYPKLRPGTKLRGGVHGKRQKRSLVMLDVLPKSAVPPSVITTNQRGKQEPRFVASLEAQRAREAQEERRWAEEPKRPRRGRGRERWHRRTSHECRAMSPGSDRAGGQSPSSAIPEFQHWRGRHQ
jgi:hypothetical protein